MFSTIFYKMLREFEDQENLMAELDEQVRLKKEKQKRHLFYFFGEFFFRVRCHFFWKVAISMSTCGWQDGI